MTQDALELIAQRRMIKPELFTDGPVREDEMEVLFQAANWAPTHGMTEPWRFTEVGKNSRTDLVDCLTEAYTELKPDDIKKEKNLAKFAGRVQSIDRLYLVYSKRGNKPNIHPMDEWISVGAAVQNMWLIASAMKLGFYWGTGMLTHHPGINSYLGLEEEDRFLGYLFIGRFEGEWPHGQRLSDWKDKVSEL